MEDKYPWLQCYPEGIPHSINPDQYDSLVDVIRESAEKYKSQVAFENIGKRMTYSEIDALSDCSKPLK